MAGPRRCSWWRCSSRDPRYAPPRQDPTWRRRNLPAGKNGGGASQMRRRTIVIALAALTVGGTSLAPALASTPAADPTVPAGRDVEPVVLTGASFPQWAAPAEVTAKAPSVAGGSCTGGGNTGTHNTYEKP